MGLSQNHAPTMVFCDRDFPAACHGNDDDTGKYQAMCHLYSIHSAMNIPIYIYIYIIYIYV